MKNRSPLPVNAWLPVLTQAHGDKSAAALIQQAEDRCRKSIAGYRLPENGHLRKHLVENILPGLAMYRTLLELHEGDQPAALAEIQPLFRAWTGQIYGSTMRLLSLIPKPFAFLRLAMPLQMRQFPREGWDFVPVEDSPARVAFDSRSCFYLKTLTELGAAELTASFCQIDDWMGEILPPSIVFRRTKTLRSEDEICDFCYENRGGG